MTGFDRALAFFKSNGRQPFDFQLQTWRHYLAGKSGLLQAPTGMGKTLAAAMGPMIDWLDHYPIERSPGCTPGAPGAKKVRKRNDSAPLTVLWITPLRALASDTAESLQPVIEALNLPWTLELRTADTSASVRKKQRDRLPTVLITTPESLSLLLSYPGTVERFENLQAVIVDEWHELLASKRGVQTELGIARLRKLRPSLRIWGLSATIANPTQSLATLVGPAPTCSRRILLPRLMTSWWKLKAFCPKK